MKKILSIVLLVAFCMYSFTFRSHYCYYAGTSKRFHGDCQWEIKQAAKKGELTKANFFPERYECFDIVKNVQTEVTKTLIVKNLSSDIQFVPINLKVPIPNFARLSWNIPEPH
ncbi:MAG: hypothetical protein KGJ07_07140, partial [Patescibacteria group bacterium]|nr:hypothetical protein [Patescibacteria group bacterium]